MSWRENSESFDVVINFTKDFTQQMKSLNRNTVFIEFICQRLGVPSLLDPQDMAQSSVVDRLSILTYLSSLYHVLAEDGKERKVSEDSGVSVEEEESVCSSCSSSSGYDSPTKVEQEEDETEEKKAEKVVRRGGADGKRGARRLVKSMIEVGEERETPFSVALRKFNTLAKSQTQLAGEACLERSLESSGQAEESESFGERASPGVRERVSEWGIKTATCPPTWQDVRVSESPQPLAALITRATQTEEERRSAAVQTSPVKPASGAGGGRWGGAKTHQRRQSIHSRAQAFLHDDSHPSLPNIPRSNNVGNKFSMMKQSSLTSQKPTFDAARQNRSNRTGVPPPCLQVAPLHSRQNPDQAHPTYQPQSLTVLPCRPPSESRLQDERLWRRTPACEEGDRSNYQRMDTLQYSHRGLQPAHRSASSPQLAHRLTAYPRQAAAILNHPLEAHHSKPVGHNRKADGVPPVPPHPQVSSPFPNYPQVLGQGSNQVGSQVSGYPRHGNKCTTAPFTFPHPAFSTLV